MTSIYFVHSFAGIPDEFSSRMSDLRRSIGAISGTHILEFDRPGAVVAADLVVAIMDHDSFDLRIALDTRKGLKKSLFMFYPRSRAEIAAKEAAKVYFSDEDITNSIDAFVARRDPLRETLRVVS